MLMAKWSGTKGSKGLVTVILSVHNGEKYLADSIDSLLTQTYKDLQIIIINDGSTDRSAEIILSYDDDRIVFVNRSDNRGLTRSLNEGLCLSKGKYVVRQDADDVSLPSRIEEQVDFLERNEDVSVLGTAVEFFDGRSTLKRFFYSDDGDEIRSQLLQFINPIPHPTLAFRREVAEKLNGYNDLFILSQDYDFLLRASEYFRLSSLRKPLVKLRFNTGSLTYTGNEQLKYGLAALICAYRRIKGVADYSVAGGKEWELFLEQVASLIAKKGFDGKFKAHKYLTLARFSLINMDLRQCAANLYLAFRNDRTFFLKRGVGLKVPDDIEELLL